MRLVLLLSVLLVFWTSCHAGVFQKRSSSSTSGETSAGTSNTNTTSINSLSVVTWKWHHIDVPYLVALWVFVCWLCKLGKQPLTTNRDHDEYNCYYNQWVDIRIRLGEYCLRDFNNFIGSHTVDKHHHDNVMIIFLYCSLFTVLCTIDGELFPVLK